MPADDQAAAQSRERRKLAGFLAGMTVIWGYPFVFLAVTHGF